MHALHGAVDVRKVGAHPSSDIDEDVGTIFAHSSPEMEMPVTHREDLKIRNAVLNELKWDPRVEEYDLSAEVSDGVVTLTGTVSSWGKRMVTAEAAQRVKGVRDVINDIDVEVPASIRRSDAQLAAAIRLSLEWDAFVDHTCIRSTVSNGWVTLEGEVPAWSDHDEVERAIRNLTGVRGLTNRITVTPPAVSPGMVRRSIEHALERRAARDAKQVAIDLRDGRVTLSGVVHSWTEKQAVVGAARGTPGVREIQDQLRIEPNAV